MDQAGIVAGAQSALAEMAEHVAGDLTEDGLARWFSRYSKNYRRVHDWHRWMVWDGTRWQHDRGATIFTAIRAFLRARAQQDAQTDQARQRLRSKQTVAAVESLCQSNPEWSTVSDQWDADAWALNTPGGVVDLRTGELSPCNPQFLHSKQTAIAPSGCCPRWLAFLHEVMGDDAELVLFLQRMAGYFLTGSTREHALFFSYGTGRNGKGVFINTLSGVLGDYAATAPMETFTESKGDRHPTDLAGLRGARLVAVSETEEGRHWNESRIKALTGGDRISARFMRGDFFAFSPTFKLLIAGNHRPRLRSVDEAMRARLHLIPWTVTIPAAQRDPDLTEKLREEWPGILAWAIAGCLEYQVRRLDPPAKVREATASYFGTQDVFGAWLTECCDHGSDKWDTPTHLFASWKRYAENAREPVGRQAEFTDRLESAGFQQGRSASSRQWKGLSVKPDSFSSADPWSE
jgi:putative DNA primase/helicase